MTTLARQYVTIRTDRTKKKFILGELEHGRLRQGWGYRESQDLRELRARVDAGRKLDEDDADAWRNRRMLDTEADGLKVGDTIVLPNLPEDGKWLVAKVEGPYTFSISKEQSGAGLDYGHILPVSVLRDPAGKMMVVDPNAAAVDARLRATMRNLGRMWSIDALGSSIERLLNGAVEGQHINQPEPEAEKAAGFFKAMRTAAWDNIRSRYRGAEFEQIVRRLFERIYANGRVEHWGGAGEKGADLIVYTSDALGLEFKIAVQVKLHEGIDDDTRALDQIREARVAHRVDAGVVVSTAVETSAKFEKQRAALEGELGIDVRVLMRDELVELLMVHFAAEKRI